MVIRSKSHGNKQDLARKLIQQVAGRVMKEPNAFLRIGFKSSNNLEIDRNIRESKIPVSVISLLGKELGLSEQKVSSLVKVSASTLSRRRQKGEGLKPDEAGRIYRIVSILSLAESTIGEHERCVRWLKTPAKFLGGVIPLDLLETEAGTEEVRKLLLRIEHSVYS